MSKHANLTSWNVANSIKNNLDAVAACESYAGMLAAAGMLATAEYDDQWGNPRYVIEMAEYMLTQRDGIYGVSHKQITDWLMQHIGGLVIEKVIFERP